MMLVARSTPHPSGVVLNTAECVLHAWNAVMWLVSKTAPLASVNGNVKTVAASAGYEHVKATTYYIHQLQASLIYALT